MNKATTDEELVSQYLTTRYNDYFAQLYKRYCDRVYQKCLSFTNDKMLADDLTQDVFIRLLNKLDSYKQQAKFSTWLYSITHNYCVNQLRTTQARQQLSRANDWEGLASIADNTYEQEELAISQAQQALQLLTPSEQDILQQKYQNDRSIRELALYYQITESAVKMRLKRSRERLRQYYQEIAQQ